MQEDLKRWQRKATKRLKDGKGAVCEFESEHIPEWMLIEIKTGLADCESVDDIVSVFETKRSQNITELLAELKNVMAVANAQPASN